MFYALDKNNIRTWADAALENTEYCCPVCGASVILKRGLVKVAHFAHKAGECADTWHYDMSEWHKKIQAFFLRITEKLL